MAIFGFSEDKTKREVDPAGKVGSATVGSTSRPIFIENGTPKITNSSSVASVSIYSGFTAFRNEVRRYGNVVSVNLEIAKDSGSGQLITIGKVPSGLEPPSSLSNEDVAIYNDGTIHVNFTSGIIRYIYLTYII